MTPSPNRLDKTNPFISLIESRPLFSRKAIEPIEVTPEEQAAHVRFAEEFRRFNIEAVRKQMAEAGEP